MRDLCLVTSTHVSANPRIVKEADALAEAGYHVTVVAADLNSRLRGLDQDIIDSREWYPVLVTRGSSFAYVIHTLVQRVARLVLRWFSVDSLWLALRAHHRLTYRLAAAAARVPAELYIGHNLAALPAAAIAAKKNRTKFGFDAEDFHTEELTLAKRDLGDQIAREIIERRLLPECMYRTAASPMIAEAYRKKYGVEMLSILNVFPLSGAPTRPVAISEILPRSLYWFSQTIGTGRGLEEMIAAMAEMKEPPDLYLRGNPAPGYADFLFGLAAEKRLKSKIHFLPCALPDQMVRLAAPYSLGLALEMNEPPNRAICLTNKLFVYLLAGVPVLLSETPAHRLIAAELGNAALLVDVTDRDATAIALQRFLNAEAEQSRARKKAWQLGRDRFNWDRQKEGFLTLVRRQFDAREPPLAAPNS